MTHKTHKLPSLRFFGSRYSNLHEALKTIDEIDEYIQDVSTLDWLQTGHVFLWKSGISFAGRLITGFPKGPIPNGWERLDLGNEYGHWQSKSKKLNQETLDIFREEAPKNGVLLWIYNFRSDDGEYYELTGDYFKEFKDILPS